MDIKEVTASTEREEEESFTRNNGFFWAALHHSIVYLFISFGKYLANEHFYTDVRSASPNASPVRVIWGLWTQQQATHFIQVEKAKMQRCDRFLTFIIHLFLETVLSPSIL